jgi:formylmethanofuran dehydrogenase subunit E
MCTFLQPETVEVQPSSDALSRQIISAGAEIPVDSVEESATMGSLTKGDREHKLSPKANSNAKSITEGLALIDKQISDKKLQDADQLLEEEDKYGNCDYCDKEILVNPFNVSNRGKYLCDDCYSSTGGKE